MNRKLGHWIKAALFALPLALPGVALAQSATDTSSPASQAPQAPQDTSNKGSLEETGKETQGSFDRADKQNAGPVDQTTPSEIDRTPPAGALDKSGPSTSSDRSIGGDINKSDDTMNMNSESTTTTTKQKKSKKSAKSSKSAPSTDTSRDTDSDMNR